MCSLHVLNQRLVAYCIANSPACGIECFTNRSNGDGEARNILIKSCYTRERCGIVKVFVNFVREYDHAVLDAKLAN